ncbi:MAG: type II secretion system protein [Sedimentisphaerales bacterium]|nr:type II secretion system protein [Sedimentisphaerales bacterium]
MKQGFTLIEVLVVIFIVGVLMGILMPALSRAREQANIVAVDSELRQIGLAIEMYFEDYKKFPPTQADCILGSLTDHLYQLPKVLAQEDYLPSKPKTDAMSTIMEDRFNRGHTYKYRSVGEIIVDRNKIDKYIWAKLWIPDNFPTNSSIEPNEECWRPNENERKLHSENKGLIPLLLPVSWVVFSLGPRFSEEWLEEKLGLENRYPVPKELWYTPKERRGFIVRMRLKNGSQTGSFEKGP